MGLPFNAFSVSTDTSSPYTEYLFDVNINKEMTGDTALFLENEKQEIFAETTELKKWRFKLPESLKTIAHEGHAYGKLSDFPGLVYKMDKQAMEIDIETPHEHLDPHAISLQKENFLVPTESSFGAYFNYDTLAQKTKHHNMINGLFSANLFSPWGAGSSDFLAEYDSQSSDHSSFHSHHHGHHRRKTKAIRLNSFWRYDDPEKMETFMFGDSYTTAGMWGNSVNIGGFSWGTNFETQPGFITFPLPSAKGMSVAPTVVDVYVNEALRSQHSAHAGPFSIDSIPITTGAGTINLVTTDLLGRQQTINVPFYVSPTILKEGLQNYNVSLGYLRKDFGHQSNKYGDLAFSGNYKRGLSDTLTGEVHFEAFKKAQTFGMGGSYILATFGIVNLSGALSHRSHSYHDGNDYRGSSFFSNHQIFHNHFDASSQSSKKTGGLVSAGFHRSAQKFSFGATLKRGSKEFTSLGSFGFHDLRRQTTAFVGFPIFEGSFSVNYVQHKSHRDNHQEFVNATFSKTLSPDWHLSVSGLASVRHHKDLSVYLTLTYILNDSTSLNVGGTAQKHNSYGTAQVTKSLPIGTGYGYNLYTSQGKQKHYQATGTYQNEMGTYTVGIDQHDHATSGQLQASGSLALMNNSVYLSRRIHNSFAVVDIPGYSDVTIYSQNQPVGTTDKDGNLLVPNLLAYQENPIRVNINDLPLDADIKKEEIKVIPYHHSGVVVKFPIKPSSGATMTLLLPSKEPISSEALVTFGEEVIPVGGNGEVYVTGLSSENSVFVQFNDEKYRCNVKFVPSDDPLPDLGEIECTP